MGADFRSGVEAEVYNSERDVKNRWEAGGGDRITPLGAGDLSNSTKLPR